MVYKTYPQAEKKLSDFIYKVMSMLIYIFVFAIEALFYDNHISSLINTDMIYETT